MGGTALGEWYSPYTETPEPGQIGGQPHPPPPPIQGTSPCDYIISSIVGKMSDSYVVYILVLQVPHSQMFMWLPTSYASS